MYRGIYSIHYATGLFAGCRWPLYGQRNSTVVFCFLQVLEVSAVRFDYDSMALGTLSLQ